MKRFLSWPASLIETWRNIRLSKTALGKYIILQASVLHMAWAVLLLSGGDAHKSTPVAIVSRICGGATRAAFVLALVSCMAIVFPFLKRRVDNRIMAVLLLPQQVLLLLSAGGGLYASIAGRYAMVCCGDGSSSSATSCPSSSWPFSTR